MLEIHKLLVSIGIYISWGSTKSMSSFGTIERCLESP